MKPFSLLSAKRAGIEGAGEGRHQHILRRNLRGLHGRMIACPK